MGPPGRHVPAGRPKLNVMKRRLFCLWLATLFPLLAMAGSAASPAAGSKDADAFFIQGNTFRSNGQPREALWAYRQAARAGSLKGALAAGEMLCDSVRASHGRERIL